MLAQRIPPVPEDASQEMAAKEGPAVPLAVETEEMAAEGPPPAARGESPALSAHIQEQDAIPGRFALGHLLAPGVVTAPGP